MIEVEAIQNGDHSVFEEVYIRWQPILLQFVQKKTGSAEIAEQVAQQTFAKIWEHRDRLSISFSLQSQIFRTAQSVLIDELRKAAHARKYLSEQNSHAPAIENNAYETREELNLVYKEIEDMPAIRKKVFMLSRMQHYSYNQIAELLSISPKTVENHIAIALKHLKKKFNNY